MFLSIICNIISMSLENVYLSLCWFVSIFLLNLHDTRFSCGEKCCKNHYPRTLWIEMFILHYGKAILSGSNPKLLR